MFLWTVWTVGGQIYKTVESKKIRQCCIKEINYTKPLKQISFSKLLHVTKNEDKNYLNGSKSIGTTFPDWVFQTLGQPEAEGGGADHLWSLTGAEEQSEESAPRSPAACRWGKKETCNLANVCVCPEGMERVRLVLQSLKPFNHVWCTWWEWSVKGKFCPYLSHIDGMAPFLFCTCGGSSARKAWLSVSWTEVGWFF